MRRNILIFPGRSCIYFLSLFLITRSFSFAGGLEIKSLRVYSSEDQTSFPVIDYSDSLKNFITIEFDVKADYFPDLNIIFRFCDADWNPYNNALLLNPIYNTERNMWFERLPASVQGARYRFTGKFPNNNVNFPYSGKWKFFIVDSQNKNLVYTSGKFFVVNPEVKLNVQVAKEAQQGEIPESASLLRTISIRTNFTLPDSLFASNVKRVEIITNRKFNYPIVIDRNSYTADRFYEWNASNKFSFIARSIRPGNEYRETDIRDITRYNTPTVNARFGDIETSNFFSRGKKDMNGASYLTDFKNEYADYMNVVFRIRPPENIKSPIFLVGYFTNWEVLPAYEMFDDKGMMNISVELKRGVYNYQYVTGEIVNDRVENIDWQILEGNFWETENEYYIFLYYGTVEKGGYDKIVGYKKIKIGAL